MPATAVIVQNGFKSRLNQFGESKAARRTSLEMPVFGNASPAQPIKPGEPARKRSSKTWLWLSLTAVAGVVGSARPWSAFASKSVADETPAADAVRAVTVERPTAAQTARVVLPATIRPWQTTTLHARVSGYLAAWHPDLGAPVRAGDLLAEIDTPELDQEVATAEALAREAVAAVRQARAERAEAEADLKVAEAQLDRTRADTELARNQARRREKLVSSRAVSEEEYDTSLKQLAARTADVAAAESDLVRRRTNLDTRAAIIEVREATARSRQASVDRLQELQGFKRIVAPFDGVVIRRTAEVGMLVTAGQDALFAVEDMSCVRVQMNVPQTYASQARPGVEAAISLPESSGRPVPAKITRVADSVDSTNRTMLAEIEVPNESYHFQPGSYAQVSLITAADNSAWSIPTNTISMRVAGPHVAVVSAENLIEIRRVTLGRDLGTRVVVIEGIHGNESLVVNPSDDLANGLRVQIRNSGETDREVVQR